MARRRVLLLLVVPLLLAGCAGAPAVEKRTPTGGYPDETDGGDAARAEAPWWNVGERWTIRFHRGDDAPRTTELVMFANNTFGDPPHFWLGTANRAEALDHVFHDSNMFLGRIHWEYLAPHEKGRHSDMYAWPLVDGKRFAAHAFERDWQVQATARDDGSFAIAGRSPDGSTIAYDYDPDTRWFRNLQVSDHNGENVVTAQVVAHQPDGATGTYWFLRGRDYLDSDGGNAGTEETFEVKDEGATSIAFLLDGIRTDTAAAIEFVDPKGEVYHREALRVGETRDVIQEVPKPPTPGEWKIRYVGSVHGTILVRGIIEYTATI